MAIEGVLFAKGTTEELTKILDAVRNFSDEKVENQKGSHGQIVDVSCGKIWQAYKQLLIDPLSVESEEMGIQLFTRIANEAPQAYFLGDLKGWRWNDICMRAELKDGLLYIRCGTKMPQKEENENTVQDETKYPFLTEDKSLKVEEKYVNGGYERSVFFRYSNSNQKRIEIENAVNGYEIIYDSKQKKELVSKKNRNLIKICGNDNSSTIIELLITDVLEKEYKFLLRSNALRQKLFFTCNLKELLEADTIEKLIFLLWDTVVCEKRIKEQIAVFGDKVMSLIGNDRSVKSVELRKVSHDSKPIVFDSIRSSSNHGFIQAVMDVCNANNEDKYAAIEKLKEKIGTFDFVFQETDTLAQWPGVLNPNDSIWNIASNKCFENLTEKPNIIFDWSRLSTSIEGVAEFFCSESHPEEHLEESVRIDYSEKKDEYTAIYRPTRSALSESNSLYKPVTGKNEVTNLLNMIGSEGNQIQPFIRVYLNPKEIDKFKNAFIDKYNENVDIFMEEYNSLKENEDADWEFVGWPGRITNNECKIMEDGLLIKLEGYELEIYGSDIPLPIEYDTITQTIEQISGFAYTYEGVLRECDDPKYGTPYYYLIGDKGRKDYSYTYDEISRIIQPKKMERPVLGNKTQKAKSSSNTFEFDNISELLFDGKIFVLTGFDEDEEAKITEMIVSRGGGVKSSTVLKTNYLIVMENYDHQTTKYKRAIELKERGNELYIIGSNMFYQLVRK